MDDMKKNVFIDSPELVRVGEDVHRLAEAMLSTMNQQGIKLFDLPAHKRIFLFILTRAMKTYSAIEVLCRSGYGQDVAVLVRSVLENLITAKYIVHDPKSADDMARRFVDYKWIIMKRSLHEEEYGLRRASEQEQKNFTKKKQMILDQVEKFKEKYQVISDRALVTWSGKTVKDMARLVSRELYDEYELTFRQCSRFSHPTILGDREYIIQNQSTLTFSTLPSPVGIRMNYQYAIRFFLHFLELVSELFRLPQQAELEKLRDSFFLLQDTGILPQPAPAERHSNIREVKIHFDY